MSRPAVNTAIVIGSIALALAGAIATGQALGEESAQPPATSVMNALSEHGITHFDMPASAPRVWATIWKARA